MKMIMLNPFMNRLWFSYLTPQRMVYITQITICGCDLESGQIISIFFIISAMLNRYKQLKEMKANSVIFFKAQEYSLSSLCRCIFCLLVGFVLIQCYTGRYSRLNGISLFQQFKDKGMIQYIHSLIPFHSFRCDMHTVWEIRFLRNAQKTRTF